MNFLPKGTTFKPQMWDIVLCETHFLLSHTALTRWKRVSPTLSHLTDTKIHLGKRFPKDDCLWGPSFIDVWNLDGCAVAIALWIAAWVTGGISVLFRENILEDDSRWWLRKPENGALWVSTDHAEGSETCPRALSAQSPCSLWAQASPFKVGKWGEHGRVFIPLSRYTYTWLCILVHCLR